MAGKFRHDVWTVGAVAALAYIVANVLHEGLGHGAACFQVGGQPHVLSTVHFDCGYEGLADWKARWVGGAGVAVNLVAGLLFYLAWRLLKRLSPVARYFLILVASVNLFMAGGYLLFLFPFGAGDGGAFADLSLILRPIFAVAGFLIYFWLGKTILAQGAAEFVDFSDSDWRRGAETLAKLSYFSGCFAVCLPGLWNPVGTKYFFASAVPSTFFGTIGLLKMAPSLRPSSGPAKEPLIVGRSVSWLCVVGAVFVLYAALLGPGWTFR